jgi:hypothetical protein
MSQRVLTINGEIADYFLAWTTTGVLGSALSCFQPLRTRKK